MSSINTKIIAIDGLSACELSAWADFRVANPALYSPYFHSEYTQLLAQLCPDVHVLVVEQFGDPIAFLPFQAKISTSGKVGFARPVGAPMTDYHGFICAPNTQFDVRTALKQAGFGAFHYSALVGSQNMLASNGEQNTACTVMDLSIGAEAWRASRDKSYRRHLKSHRRRVRKAEELGPRRLAFMSPDKDVFEQLINWKCEKFAETGRYNVLSAPWTRALLENLWQRGADAEFRADMHALYFGDQLAAIDLGLCDGVTFHSWMVAYNADFQTLAPGIQLLEAIIDAAGDLGYGRIDLGEGIGGYKRHYASEDVAVGSGFIAVSGPSATLSKLYGGLESFGETKLGKVGKLPGKVRRRYSQISACDATLTGRSRAMLQAVRG
ncbi:MAG: GNAT family N-acetyltransferase [Robiginitomaculum sp.]|nr:GNAT family N-acetyltransferase [Robiginitomaculum sp.]